MKPILRLVFGALFLAMTGLTRSDDRVVQVVATSTPGPVGSFYATGSYTAIVRGMNGTTGIGLVEAYNLQ